MARLTKHDYEQAIQVQGACNLSGVVFEFARVMQSICDEAAALGEGTNWKNHHPIAVLYASKIESLTGLQHDSVYDSIEVFSKAYDACCQEITEWPKDVTEV